MYFTVHYYTPHVISISDANYDNFDKVKTKNYRIETNDLGVGHNISRQILLINNLIDYTRTYDNIDRYIAAIVIHINLADKQNVTLIAHYRQWTIPVTPTDVQYNISNYLDNKKV